jgi:hypothetical protein
MKSTISVARRLVNRPYSMVATVTPMTVAPRYTRSIASSTSSNDPNSCRTLSSCICVTCMSTRRLSSSSSQQSRRAKGIITVASVVGVAVLTLTTTALAESKKPDEKRSTAASSSSSTAGMSPEEARIAKFQEIIDKERRRLEVEANGGNAKSQLALGVLLLRDVGTLEGVKWIRMAASQGLPDAQHAMAILQLDGLGSPSDQVNGGNGVAKDQSNALATLRRLAGNGHADSQLALAMVFDQGIGVTKDPTASADWFVLTLTRA